MQLTSPLTTKAGRTSLMNSSGEFKFSVLDELTPGEAALVEHFRALPLAERRALLNLLDRAVIEAAAGARPLAFLWGDAQPLDARY